MTKISIHALREEGDVTRRVPLTLTLYFYPRPPRGGRPILRSAVLAAKGISIHALREEGDSSPFFKGKIAVLISIHALREEGDALYNNKGQLNNDFYPRPPRGGRQRGCGEPQGSNQFLSTPSARRATPIFSTRLS